MVVSTVVSGAGAGAFLAGEARQLGRSVPVKLINWLPFNEHHQKCVLQLPGASFFNSRPSRSSSHSASAKKSSDGFFPDVSDETDEMYDELFKRYGKVVFKSTDQKSATEEAEEDAESLSFAVEMAKVASDVKAAELKINAIGSKMRDLAEQKYGRVATGDVKPNSWTLLDFGDVVIHIFLPEQREFYKLDEFYGNATSIDLPFENQPPSGR